VQETNSEQRLSHIRSENFREPDAIQLTNYKKSSSFDLQAIHASLILSAGYYSMTVFL
jgi:hypothetical protein